jgi:2-keto-3-deoxy-L-rhamnonate aldolase RhmA
MKNSVGETALFRQTGVMPSPTPLPVNPVRAALRHRQLCPGGWIQIGHPAVAEIFGRAGFAWVGLDCEHSDLDLGSLAGLLRGLHGRGPVPLVRVRENQTLAIRQALDLGAGGVIVPLVHNAAAARAAVRAAKYPPAGERGFAFTRANDYGADFDAYARGANEQTAVVVMIESREAVENIESILGVEGVDGVFVGPYDLSGSYGVPGEIEHPAVVAAQQRVLAACAAAGRSAGLHLVTPTPESVRATLARGFTFLALGMDTVFLRESARMSLDLANLKTV